MTEGGSCYSGQFRRLLEQYGTQRLRSRSQKWSQSSLIQLVRIPSNEDIKPEVTYPFHGAYLSESTT